ncbi:MAG: mechanosensitive ion channel domain-containing protein [Pirellulales bacterium]
MKSRWLLAGMALMGLTSYAGADEPAKSPLEVRTATSTSNPAVDLSRKKPTPAQPGQVAAATPESPVSEGEKVVRLQRGIDADQARLLELQATLSDPRGEFAQSQAEFEELDKKLMEARKLADDPEAESPSEEQQAVLAALDMSWQMAKERFDLDLEERKVLQEQIATLQLKIETNKAALNRLVGSAEGARVEPGASPAVAAPAIPNPAVAAAAPATSPVSSPLAASMVPGAAVMAAATAPENAPTPQVPAEAAPAPAAVPAAEKPLRAEVAEAAEAVRKTEADALQAEDEARSVAERIELLRVNIRQTRALREMARKKVDLSDAAVHKLQDELQAKLAAGDDHEAIQKLNKEIDLALQRWRDARTESRNGSNRLDDLQTELDDLLSDHLAASDAAETKRKEAEAAKARLEIVQNPFTPRNLLNWLIDHGPRILGLLLAMMFCVWLARAGGSRLVEIMARRSVRGGAEERANLARTLAGVFHNMATVVIVTCGSLALLDEIGLPVGPLMGGAAVAGLAIAFGAQNLIKDFFTGFMILLEQQYMVNDVIRIGDIAGQVERITLRMTVLRDLEGRVHFMPHGQILAVTNLTHGWSRAVFDIGVAYKENVDRVMQVLMDLGRQLRRDQEYGPLILDDPTMLGVDAFADSAVMIKFYIKTRPLRQWPVKRELLRRIKNKFDELGIEIPFPHRTLYHPQAALDIQPRDNSDLLDDRSAA